MYIWQGYNAYEKVDKKTRMNTGIKQAAVLLVVFVLGLFIGYQYEIRHETQQAQEFPYLAKQLFIENPNDIRFDFTGLKNALLNDIGPDNENIGVYFEYLSSGVSFTINPELEVVAASLMKTAVAMEIYKLVERGNLSFDQQVTITEDLLNDEYGDLYKTALGKSYSIEELVNIMLIESDNTASETLISLLPFQAESVLNVFNTLDEQRTVDVDNRLTITSQQYSRLFKCLYLACYNNKTDSNEILEILSRTNSTDRITKLLPEDVRVSHKFGSFSSIYRTDCGIVYAQDGAANYSLCIVIRGTDPVASQEMARISLLTYNYVDSITNIQ